MRPVTYSWLAVVLAVSCAAIHWLGLAGWMAVVVLVASIGMHVAGNALGTKLREATDRDLTRLRRRPQVEIAAAPAQPCHLERRSGLGRLVPVSIAVGGICGGVSGATCLIMLTSTSPAGALLGGVSSAVIGGFAGFLGASFVEIVRTSLREAIAAEQPTGVPEPRG